MSAVGAIQKGTENQAVTESTGTTPTNPEGEFEVYLRGILSPGPSNKVSEEELFAALVQQRVETEKGSAGVEAYNSAFKSHSSASSKPDGFFSHEEAASEALNDLVATGALTENEADKIYSEAFAAAQLDSNTDTLWDSRGGSNDPSIAIDTMESALAAAKLQITAFEDGSKQAEARKLSEAFGTMNMRPHSGSAPLPSSGGSSEGESVDSSHSSGSTGNGNSSESSSATTRVDGDGGFLFDPKGGAAGVLSIYTPEALSAFVEKILLKDLNNNLLEEGSEVEGEDDEKRKKFEFSKKGSEYPQDLTVELHLKDGKVEQYLIIDPSKVND